ncbi:multiple stress resistance protein BhsA, partial [Klebsiella pneumoniae]
PAGQHKVGTISASAGTNLGSLEDQLAQKADEMGATSYRITSVTGPNTLHGTAVIYK